MLNDIVDESQIQIDRVVERKKQEQAEKEAK